MMKNNYITLFIVILVCGLFVEGLKSFSGLGTNKTDKMSGFSFQEMDTKPFYLSQSDKDSALNRVNAKGGRTRGGFKLNSTQTDLSKKILAKDETPGVAESGEKTDAKKKKKKKKVAKNRRLFKPQLIGEKNSNPDSEKQTTDGADGSKASQFVSQFNPGARSENELPITYEDWAKLILGSPQPDNVAKLVEFFSNKMVSAEIFYGILNAMLEDSDPEQHKLAVFAAGNVPNAMSFIFLVQVLKTDAQGAPSSIKAVEQIAAYQTLNNVVHLKSVLSSPLSDVNVVQMAVNSLDKATQQFLENRTPSAEDTSIPAEVTTPDNDSSSNQSNITKAFSGFEPILEQVIQTYQSNPSITEPAQRSLTRITKNLSVVLADTNG